MSVIDRSAEPDLKKKIDDIYRSIERHLRSNGLCFLYKGPGIGGTGFVGRVSGMDVWEKEKKEKKGPFKRFLDWLGGIGSDEPSVPDGPEVFTINFDENTVTLYDCRYKSLAESIGGLLGHKKRWEEALSKLP